MATSSLVVLALLLLSLSSSIGAREYNEDFLSDEEFQVWVSHHYDGKIDLEEVYPTWRRNADFVKQRNSLQSSYSLSVNKFAHLENMDGYLNSPQMTVSSATNKNAELNKNRCQESPRSPTAPESVDWREKGVVPPVTNQGQINSAITYAVVDSIDSLWAIEKNHYKLVLGSYEEYQDCCVTNKAFLNSSCFTCVTQLGGLASLADYNSPNHTCRSDAFKPVVTVNDGAFVQPTGDEKALAEQVAVQPVAALINAALTSFQMYSSGIYDDPNCSSSPLNHLVLVVGYGSQNGKDFWIVKNSWGADWGEKGYILIARNEKNICGIASQAIYPVLFC